MQVAQATDLAIDLIITLVITRHEYYKTKRGYRSPHVSLTIKDEDIG